MGAPERRWGVILDVLRARGPLEFAGRRDPPDGGRSDDSQNLTSADSHNGSPTGCSALNVLGARTP